MSLYNLKSFPRRNVIDLHRSIERRTRGIRNPFQLRNLASIPASFQRRIFRPDKRSHLE